jgi:hypothetical protein
LKIIGFIRLIVWLLETYNLTYAEITGVSNFEIALRSNCGLPSMIFSSRTGRLNALKK